MFEKMKSIIAAQLNVSEDEVTEEASFKDDLDAERDKAIQDRGMSSEEFMENLT